MTRLATHATASARFAGVVVTATLSSTAKPATASDPMLLSGQKTPRLSHHDKSSDDLLADGGTLYGGHDSDVLSSNPDRIYGPEPLSTEHGQEITTMSAVVSLGESKLKKTGNLLGDHGVGAPSGSRQETETASSYHHGPVLRAIASGGRQHPARSWGPPATWTTAGQMLRH